MDLSNRDEGQGVSVALATYNGEDYLAEQLDSILIQTVPPREIVIFDDGSTDSTMAILEEFAQRVPFTVKIFRNACNLGYVRNFDRVLQACSGSIVFLCDQDDVWFPEKIEGVLKVFSECRRATLVVHDLEFCDRDLVPIGQTKLQRMAQGADIERDYVVGMATAVRGDFLRLCLPIPASVGMAHDRWLHDCAAAVGGKVVLPQVLALYRRHGENATAGKAVNVDYVTGRWSFLWARFREPSRVKALTNVPASALADWLEWKRSVLVQKGYLKPVQIDQLVARERDRTNVLRVRNGLLQLPRWQRLVPVCKLLVSGGYGRFFSWKSALKDLVRR